MHSLAFFTSLCLYFKCRLSHVSSVLLHLMVMAEKKKGRPSRFRSPKSASEEQVLADEAVPSPTKYKNKWALKYFGNGSRKGRRNYLL